MAKDELSEYFRGRSVIPEESLAEWIRRLTAGESGPKAEALSVIIIRDFISRVSLDKPQSKITLEWLADALEKILDFEDARTAMTLPKRGKHRPAGVGILKAADVVRWIALTMERGYSEKEAADLAVNCFNCDESYVRRMRVQASGWAQGMSRDADWEGRFRDKGKPLPRRKPRARTD
jgi:hypothetical protein